MSDWKALATARTVEDFCAEYPHELLIGDAHAEPAEPTRSARTLRLDPAELKRLLAATSMLSLVLPLVKRLSTFPSMISVGRTANNDLVIDDPQVSKFHASFRRREGVLELEDADSANGSYVDGVALVKGTPRALAGGELIRFGAVSFRLHTAESAWRWLTRTS